MSHKAGSYEVTFARPVRAGESPSSVDSSYPRQPKRQAVNRVRPNPETHQTHSPTTPLVDSGRGPRTSSLWVILAALGGCRGRCVSAPPGLEGTPLMTWTPEFQRADDAAGRSVPVISPARFRATHKYRAHRDTRAARRSRGRGSSRPNTPGTGIATPSRCIRTTTRPLRDHQHRTSR
jgi:hypothetical protein